MSQPNTEIVPTHGPALPRPIVKKMWWPFPLIWIIPLVAAGLAGYYLYHFYKARGTEIEISFSDASGLMPNQSTVQFHGAAVGRVQSITLSDDHQTAIVKARISDEASFLIKQHTIFYLVKPQLSLDSVRGLNTLMSGPYIEAIPGDGDEVHFFQGLGEMPIIDRPGEKIILHAETMGDIVVDSPINYRGVQVGVVQDIRLSDVADSTNITIYIWQPYTPLIRAGTQFWPVKGFDVKGGLFSGLQVKLGSLRALLGGGITFATPETDLGPPVPEFTNFTLNEQSKPEWFKWKPKIPIAAQPVPEPNKSDQKPTDAALPMPKQ